MFSVLLILVILMHGLIHLMGFVKAFDLVSISQFSQDISKLSGVIWLIAAFLFFITAFVLILKKGWWWMPGAFAVILSIALISTQWHDARFGLVPNLIIQVGLIISFALWNFNNKVNNEIKKLQSAIKYERKIITDEMITDLPIPVQRWLKYSGVIGKEKIHSVYLKQKGLMKLKPDQKKWLHAQADQYFTIDKPSFIWWVNTSIAGIPVIGSDLFRDGKGKMQIKLAGIIPVVNVADNPKLNQPTLQRYLGEIVWFPTAALSPYIKWDYIDNYSVKATMSYGETTGSAIFHFDEKGELTKFVAYRFKDISDQEPTEWIAKVLETKNLRGFRIPTKIEAAWQLEEGEFTWYKFEINDITYNIVN